MTFIKLEDVLDTLKRVGDEQQRPDLYVMIGFVAGLFEKTPKYDFSEQQTTVVRCKDCAYALFKEGVVEHGHIACTKPYTERWQVAKPNDWFCADGERRSDNG